MDAEFDELAAALSKDPRDQLTSGIGLFYTFSTAKYFSAYKILCIVACCIKGN
jgi:hypothetical protein